MKTILLILCLFFPCLYAQTNEISKTWYLKGGCGLNYLTLNDEKETIIEMNVGLYANCSVGYQFKENLHAEFEGAFRKNAGYTLTKGIDVYDLEGYVYTYSGMLNFILDFPFEDLFVFSLGAGTGVQNTTGELKYEKNSFTKGYQTPIVEIRNHGMAVQGIVRLLVQFIPKCGVCTEYKYWKTPNDHQNHTFAANLKIDF